MDIFWSPAWKDGQSSLNRRARLPLQEDETLNQMRIQKRRKLKREDINIHPCHIYSFNFFKKTSGIIFVFQMKCLWKHHGKLQLNARKGEWEGEIKESGQHRNDKLWDAVDSQQSEARKESSWVVCMSLRGYCIHAEAGKII